MRLPRFLFLPFLLFAVCAGSAPAAQAIKNATLTGTTTITGNVTANATVTGTFTLPEAIRVPTAVGNSGKILASNGTTWTATTGSGTGDLLSTSNLADVASALQARYNLGLTDSTATDKLKISLIPTEDIEIIARKGTDAERLTVIFASGELVWTTDTHKLYVGDGSTLGGVVVFSGTIPVGSITGLGTGVATFLATPTSENLAGALTDESGSSGGFLRANLSTATQFRVDSAGAGTQWFSIGTTGSDAKALDVEPAFASTSTTQYGGYFAPTFSGSATSNGFAGYFRANTAATAYTQTNSAGIYVANPLIGSGSASTNVYGIKIAAQTSGGTTNYAIYSDAGKVRFGDDVTLTGILTAGSGPTVITDSAGKVLSAALNTVGVAQGGTGITSFGAGIATLLGTPSSANLAAALTDETGSGASVFATSPNLVTPNIGAATGTSLAASSFVGAPKFNVRNTGNTALVGGLYNGTDANSALSVSFGATDTILFGTGKVALYSAGSGDGSANYIAANDSSIELATVSGTITLGTGDTRIISTTETANNAGASGSFGTLGGASIAKSLRVGGVIYSGTAPTTLTDTSGKVLSAALNTVGVAQGGTGLTSGTSGGVPYYSSASAITSSAALASGNIVLGGGAGAAPATTATASGAVTFLGTPSSANLAALVTDEVGTGPLQFSNIVFSDQTASYTLQAGDAGKWVSINNTTSTTLTVPKNSTVSYSAGTQIIVEQRNTGQITITPVDANVTINYRASANKTAGQHATAVLTLLSVSGGNTTWNLSGDITP